MKRYQFIVTIMAVVIILGGTEAFSQNPNTTDAASILWALFFIIVSGLIGYVVGAIKSFREEKQKIYGVILPPIVRMGYRPHPDDEKEFNQALSKLWVYASKKVAMKVDRVVSIVHDQSRGDLTKAAQEAIAEMRKDVQIWSWQRLRAQEVKHIYTQIIGKGSIDSQNQDLDN